VTGRSTSLLRWIASVPIAARSRERGMGSQCDDRSLEQNATTTTTRRRR